MIRDWDGHELGGRARLGVVSLAAALYDPEGRSAHERELGFSALADDVGCWLGTPSRTTRVALLALLVVLEVSPIRFGYGPRSMSALAPSERVGYLAALDAARTRALDVWKAVLGMAYFAGERGDARMKVVRAPSTLLVKKAGRATTRVPLRHEAAESKHSLQSIESIQGRVA